ncbi:hypothetical protein D3C74_211180 [compost metagenome]
MNKKCIIIPIVLIQFRVKIYWGLLIALLLPLLFYCYRFSYNKSQFGRLRGHCMKLFMHFSHMGSTSYWLYELEIINMPGQHFVVAVILISFDFSQNNRDKNTVALDAANHIR